MAEFQTGFCATGRVLLRIVGGCAAVLLLALTVLLVLVLAAALFDWATTALGRRWERQGHGPRNRLEGIILDAYRKRDDKPGEV